MRLLAIALCLAATAAVLPPAMPIPPVTVKRTENRLQSPKMTALSALAGKPMVVAPKPFTNTLSIEFWAFDLQTNMVAVGTNAPQRKAGFKTNHIQRSYGDWAHFTNIIAFPTDGQSRTATVKGTNKVMFLRMK